MYINYIEGKNIKIQYPYSKDILLYDGKSYEVMPISLYYIDSNIYVMSYFDRGNKITFLIRNQNDDFATVPLSDYSGVNEYLNQVELKKVDITHLYDKEIITTKIITLDELKNFIERNKEKQTDESVEKEKKTENIQDGGLDTLSFKEAKVEKKSTPIIDFKFDQKEIEKEKNIYICYDEESKNILYIYHEPTKLIGGKPNIMIYSFYPEKYPDKIIRCLNTELNGETIQYQEYYHTDTFITDKYIFIPAKKGSIESGALFIESTNNMNPEEILYRVGQTKNKKKILSMQI